MLAHACNGAITRYAYDLRILTGFNDRKHLTKSGPSYRMPCIKIYESEKYEVIMKGKIYYQAKDSDQNKEVENLESFAKDLGFKWQEMVTSEMGVVKFESQQDQQPSLLIKYVSDTVGHVVLAHENIEKGQFVCVYAGILNKSTGLKQYTHGLDVKNPSSNETVDAESVGNVSRFLPHLPYSSWLKKDYSFSDDVSFYKNKMPSSLEIIKHLQHITGIQDGWKCYEKTEVILLTLDDSDIVKKLAIKLNELDICLAEAKRNTNTKQPVLMLSKIDKTKLLKTPSIEPSFENKM